MGEERTQGLERRPPLSQDAHFFFILKVSDLHTYAGLGNMLQRVKPGSWPVRVPVDAPPSLTLQAPVT